MNKFQWFLLNDSQHQIVTQQLHLYHYHYGANQKLDHESVNILSITWQI